MCCTNLLLKLDVLTLKICFKFLILFTSVFLFTLLFLYVCAYANFLFPKKIIYWSRSSVSNDMNLKCYLTLNFYSLHAFLMPFVTTDNAHIVSVNHENYKIITLPALVSFDNCPFHDCNKSTSEL